MKTLVEFIYESNDTFDSITSEMKDEIKKHLDETEFENLMDKTSEAIEKENPKFANNYYMCMFLLSGYGNKYYDRFINIKPGIEEQITHEMVQNLEKLIDEKTIKILHDIMK